VNRLTVKKTISSENKTAINVEIEKLSKFSGANQEQLKRDSRFKTKQKLRIN
jgi:hypothetical protein